MLSQNDTILWRRLERLEERILEVETRLYKLDGQIRARLKEEADEREVTLTYAERLEEADKIDRSLR